MRRERKTKKKFRLRNTIGNEKRKKRATKKRKTKKKHKLRVNRPKMNLNLMWKIRRTIKK